MVVAPTATETVVVLIAVAVVVLVLIRVVEVEVERHLVQIGMEGGGDFAVETASRSDSGLLVVVVVSTQLRNELVNEHTEDAETLTATPFDINPSENRSPSIVQN